MLETLNELIASFASAVWGLPLVILLIGGGLFLLIYSRFLPFRYLGHSIAVLSGKYDNKEDEGEISHFQALTTALSATIGMGNIAGVALAISVGGPGALFWMWMSAIVGMGTKFFTGTLSIMYRGKDSAGSTQGGPMYFIMEGMGKKWKPLAILFSVAGLVGALPVFTVNQLTEAIMSIMMSPPPEAISELASYNSDIASYKLIVGIVLAIITAIVILGGISRISKTAAKLVPAMVVLYFLSVLVVLGMNVEELPKYFGLIFTDAFSASNFKGDPMLGGVLGALIIHGIRRGAFSNEAGIGTAPMAHGAVKTAQPVREGLVAMLGPAIDTIIVCTLTALAILVTDVWQTSGDDVKGVSLTVQAFTKAMPAVGKYVILICIVIFSLSSLFSYNYYGTKCLSFLAGDKNKKYYNIVYIVSILLGATTSLSMMINLIDGFFALMAIPTMIAALWMAPRVMKAAKIYFNDLKG